MKIIPYAIMHCFVYMNKVCEDYILYIYLSTISLMVVKYKLERKSNASFYI